MLGKKIQIEIFGTLIERKLYSGIILNNRSKNPSQVYVITNTGLPDTVDCTVIAIASTKGHSQTRLIVAPDNEVFYEPQIRERLSQTNIRFEKIVCVYEKSCGAVVYRKNKGEDLSILLVKNHNGKCWTFPKGHVEENETEQQTALREIKEETGLSVVLEPNFRRTSIYRPFGKVRKRVVFFLARSESGEVNVQQSEIDNFLWTSIDDALKLCRHDNDTRILNEVKLRLLPQQ